jgi:hypothetical protein
MNVLECQVKEFEIISDATGNYYKVWGRKVTWLGLRD